MTGKAVSSPTSACHSAVFCLLFGSGGTLVDSEILLAEAMGFPPERCVVIARLASTVTNAEEA
ncbi:hypothetical protein [Halomonas eurihalina]|uniref:hypothetical protein n=1 Tax=Halomonas eurihalina TaxID=42566 RepID=UPI00165967FC|nr:hypothetical protein [Halomonas eurihalina]MDR5860272.1 hypothetical protein [Halomonas eurihalina]